MKWEWVDAGYRGQSLNVKLDLLYFRLVDKVIMWH